MKPVITAEFALGCAFVHPVAANFWNTTNFAVEMNQ